MRSFRPVVVRPGAFSLEHAVLFMRRPKQIAGMGDQGGFWPPSASIPRKPTDHPCAQASARLGSVASRVIAGGRTSTALAGYTAAAGQRPGYCAEPVGPFLFLYSALVGFFAFAAIYHLILWWTSRREPLLAVFSLDCLARSALSAVLVAIATSTTTAEAQAALRVRIALGFAGDGHLAVELLARVGRAGAVVRLAADRCARSASLSSTPQSCRSTQRSPRWRN